MWDIKLSRLEKYKAEDVDLVPKCGI